MKPRIPPTSQEEYWSNVDQGVHRSWEGPQHDQPARLQDPIDYSAVGGPENERAYGRARSDTGRYPFTPHGAAPDRDPYGPPRRGRYLGQGL